MNGFVGAFWGVTVPYQQKLPPLLDSISGCDSLSAAAFAAGGVKVGDVSLNLLAQGNTKDGVTITDMYVKIIKRSRPGTGSRAAAACPQRCLGVPST